MKHIYFIIRAIVWISAFLWLPVKGVLILTKLNALGAVIATTKVSIAIWSWKTIFQLIGIMLLLELIIWIIKYYRSK